MFLLPSEQPGSLLGAIWCSLEFWTQNSCCHFLPVLKRHAAKLKTGSTGSCDQLARVPLVLRRVLARVRDRTCERNSFQPVFMWPFSPVFFSLSYAGLRFTPLCRPLTTDWTRKSHFFRPVWPSFSTALESDSNLLVGNGTSVSVN